MLAGDTSKEDSSCPELNFSANRDYTSRIPMGAEQR
jgi:hypothetical protein